MKEIDRKEVTVTTSRMCPYLNRIAILSEVFTPDVCKEIIKVASHDWKSIPGPVQGGSSHDTLPDFNWKVDLTYRNNTVYTPSEPVDWLFSRIFSTIMECNNKSNGYQFHINSLQEFPTMMKYEAADINKNGTDGHYDWHTDVGPSRNSSIRKLSYTLLLNPGEYEGGGLCFHMARNYDEPFPGQDKPGSMIIFPSYAVHKVLPVTKGTRYALVGWAHGNSFM